VQVIRSMPPYLGTSFGAPPLPPPPLPSRPPVIMQQHAGGGNRVLPARQGARPVEAEGAGKSTDEGAAVGVGNRVKVFWDGEQQWFCGVVEEVGQNGQVHVRYEDDDEMHWEDPAGCFLAPRELGTKSGQAAPRREDGGERGPQQLGNEWIEEEEGEGRGSQELGNEQGDQEEGISQYEQQRLENISRNRAVLQSLGIDKPGSLLQAPSRQPAQGGGRKRQRDESGRPDRGAKPGGAGKKMRTRPRGPTEVKIGERMLARHADSQRWLSCLVVGQQADGRFVVGWEHGDTDDLLKRRHELKLPSKVEKEKFEVAEGESGVACGTGQAATTGNEGHGLPSQHGAAVGQGGAGECAGIRKKGVGAGKGMWGCNQPNHRWKERLGSRVTTGTTFCGLHHVFCYPISKHVNPDRGTARWWVRVLWQGKRYYCGAFACSTKAAWAADYKVGRVVVCPSRAVLICSLCM
jgi:hypothetical protein